MYRLIRFPDRSGHAAAAIVAELEEAIASSGHARVTNGRALLPAAAGRLIWELHRRSLWTGRPFARMLSRNRETRYLAVLMGRRFRNCLPFFAFGGRNAIYMFDAWPAADEEVRAFAAAFGVAHLFVSASQSAKRLTDREIAAQVHWVPEGVEPDRYPYRPSAEKDIDVLQFGRKWDSYHEKVLEPLASEGKSYLYEKVKGQIIFPSRAAFLDALARTRISLCFPSSVTHPERAGDVCTMTSRYLESMAAKCLVVGIQPPEMDLLFDHAPVIPADPDDPAGQLLDILAHFDDYTDLIERNHRAVCEHHTWRRRWEQMERVLSSPGETRS